MKPLGLATEDLKLIQNQVALQRNPPIAKPQAASSSHEVFNILNMSYNAEQSPSGSLEVIEHSNQIALDLVDSVPDSGASNDPNALNVDSLKRSNSRSTIRSNASVRSVHALGALPLDSLRIHQVAVEEENKLPSPEGLTSGDVVIVSGMPTGALFGFDTIVFSVGKEGQFEGVKDIPSGPHFFYGSSSSDVSTRNGFWIMSQKRGTSDNSGIFVRRWSNYSETLEDETSAAEIKIQKDNVPKIFDSLIPYSVKPDSAFQSLPEDPRTKIQTMWHLLTFAIKGNMLSNITGNKWNKWHISSTYERKPTDWKASSTRTDEIQDRATDSSDLMTGTDMILMFAFPRTGNTFSSDVIGRARTEQAMDTSSHILAIIDDRCMEDEEWVIGELQFSFITGTMLGNLTCQEQWEHLVRIIFKAFRLSMDKPVFFRKIIEAIHAQLIYDEDCIEGSIFDHDEGLKEGMKILLTVFKSRLNEQLLAKGSALSDEQIAVGNAFEELESWLWKWGWDLRDNYVRSGKIQLEDGEFMDAELSELQAEDERGEWAPTVVELDEDGREKGLVTW